MVELIQFHNRNILSQKGNNKKSILIYRFSL